MDRLAVIDSNKDREVPWQTISSAQLHEKVGILLSVRDVTGQPPRTMPQSPVQIYPALLQDHFGSKQPLPPSRHYLYIKDSERYNFADIGPRLKMAQ